MCIAVRTNVSSMMSTSAVNNATTATNVTTATTDSNDTVLTRIRYEGEEEDDDASEDDDGDGDEERDEESDKVFALLAKSCPRSGGFAKAGQPTSGELWPGVAATDIEQAQQPVVGRQITAPSIARQTRRYLGMQHLRGFELGKLREVSFLGGASSGAFDLEDHNGAHVSSIDSNSIRVQFVSVAFPLFCLDLPLILSTDGDCISIRSFYAGSVRHAYVGGCKIRGAHEQ